MLKQFTLDNGLKVVTYSIPQMRSVFLAISAKGGSVFDTPETSGAAHFMEHILVQAIPSFPTAEQLNSFMESLAGGFNASTGFGYIRFNASAPAMYTDDLLKIAGEVFYEPLFKEDDIERERGAVLQEIAQRQDALWYKNNQFFKKIRFAKNHPVQLDGGGAKDSVLKLKKKDLVSYWEKFFDPKNGYLVVVGGFNNDKIEEKIKETFKKYNGKKAFIGFPKMTNADLNPRAVGIRQDKELQTCYVDLSFPSTTSNDSIKTRAAYRMARAVLGNLRTSRLFTELRQRRGLVYDVGFGSGGFEDYGFGIINSQVSVEYLDQVLQIITEELKKFREIGPTKAELANAKNIAKNQSLMQFDHPLGIATWIEGDLLWEDKIYTPEEDVEIMESITMEDVMDTIVKSWDFSKLNLTIQGPIEDSKENIEKYSEIVESLK